MYIIQTIRFCMSTCIIAMSFKTHFVYHHGAFFLVSLHAMLAKCYKGSAAEA